MKKQRSIKAKAFVIGTQKKLCQITLFMAAGGPGRPIMMVTPLGIQKQKKTVTVTVRVFSTAISF